VSGVQKIATLVIGVALVTTLVLPGRNSVSVINSLGRLGQGTLGTAMGTTTGVSS
jgi:hypothetical protein